MGGADIGSAWTGLHRDWLASLRFDDRASELTLEDMLHVHDSMLARRERLERALGELAEASPWAGTINRLRCLRGIDMLSAVGLQAEIGDIGRFAHPKQLAGYLGLVPSEHTSGEQRRQGAITKAGSKHARRLLVEAAWHYRLPPRMSTTLERRQRGQDARAIDAAWRCQRRLYERWQRLDSERGKRRTICAVAVARELSAFCWEIGNTQLRHHRGCRGGARRTIRATSRTPAREWPMGSPAGQRPMLDSEPATKRWS